MIRVKKFGMSLFGVALMLSTAGCAALSDAFKSIEDSVKAPPQAVVDALRLGADFLLGLINTAVHLAFNGLLGGLFGKLGI